MRHHFTPDSRDIGTLRPNLIIVNNFYFIARKQPPLLTKQIKRNDTLAPKGGIPIPLVHSRPQTLPRAHCSWMILDGVDGEGGGGAEAEEVLFMG